MTFQFIDTIDTQHEIISPPVTPTLTVQSTFYQNYHKNDEESISNSHPFPLSPPHSTLSRSSIRAMAKHYMQSPPTYRVKTNPKRSPSLSRRSFSIPIIPKSLIKQKPKMKTTTNETHRIKISCFQDTREKKRDSSDELSDDMNEGISKKAKTDAAVLYDNIDADSNFMELLGNKDEWMPNYDVFNRKPNIRIIWKASPLKIQNMPYYEKLHPGEVIIASTLRLTPEQYLKCKWALILAAQKASDNNALFRKSEAQKVCCIDVNKTSILWSTLGKLGWLGSKWPH
ncbi:hypothetical protein BDB01DRAFT_848826 [Pilobolus umbonatus]|nr:hypothetical protein BDB01DRAFT_848826 [Pilobolus umbonatus]